LVGLFLRQLAIKRTFKFSPHPMCASALPGKNGTHARARRQAYRWSELVSDEALHATELGLFRRRQNGAAVSVNSC